MNRMSSRPRLAVIGAGISGLSMAWLARDSHDVTVFEAERRAGGHADTQIVDVLGQEVAVDTGFIVYNERNYPNLIGLFDALGVVTKPTDMSFGVSIAGGRMEYAGGEISQMFAQKANLLRPRFWRMLVDILRFYRAAPELLAITDNESLGDWLARNRYSAAFVEDHILPMGAAIWSASVDGMRAFPVRHFARFFQNHGLLQLTGRPFPQQVQRLRRLLGGSIAGGGQRRARTAGPEAEGMYDALWMHESPPRAHPRPPRRRRTRSVRPCPRALAPCWTA